MELLEKTSGIKFSVNRLRRVFGIRIFEKLRRGLFILYFESAGL